MTCRPPAPADTRLTGLLVRTERFWGFKKSGVVTRFGVLPAEVLANSRLLPSRDVMGIVPLDARAAEMAGRRLKLETKFKNTVENVQFPYRKTIKVV